MARFLDVFFGIILVIGGLNWGLVGIFNFNFVLWVLHAAPVLVRIVYILVGLAALWQIFQFKSIQNRWGNSNNNNNPK